MCIRICRIKLEDTENFLPQPLKLHTAGIVGNTGTHGEESLYQSTPINFTHEGKLATEHTLKFMM